MTTLTTLNFIDMLFDAATNSFVEMMRFGIEFDSADFVSQMKGFVRC